MAFPLKLRTNKSPNIPTQAVTAPTDVLKPRTKAPIKKSTKTSYKANRKSSSNTLKGPRKVATGKNNPDQIVKSGGSLRPAKSKSSRVVYKTLRTLRRGGV